MIGKVVDKPVSVFRAANGVVEAPFAEVPIGTELQFGDTKLISGRQCTAVILPDGQRGYVFGDTKILKFKRVLLKVDKVPVRQEPDFESNMVTTLARGSAVHLVETLDRGGKQWNKLRTPAGVEGYIEAITPVSIVPDASKAAGRQYLWSGMRWWAAALALALLGAALGLRANGMCLMACVPAFQGIRFTILGAWHLRTAPV